MDPPAARPRSPRRARHGLAAVGAVLSAAFLAGPTACRKVRESAPAEATSPSTPPAAASCSTAPVEGTPQLRAEPLASSLDRPVDLQTPGDRSRLFVVEQRGKIRLLRGGVLVPGPFLDISDRVGTEAIEQGFLGLAFHPRFAENGRFFVNYTSLASETHIAEFRAAPGADTADPATERTILVAEQPFSSHNAGQLAFGPDGMLYIGLGDGGSAADPLGNGQFLGTLLGKILRIDVDGGVPYAIPAGNPFLLEPRARREVWALGLRNPWRFAFDRRTGDLYIGDVGQGRFEEIDVGLASRHGGENYGWAVTEGTSCFPPSADCPLNAFTPPVAEYGHGEGCSVIGGVVYRGCRMPGYAGTYFYGDYCSGFVRSFRLENGRAVDERDWTGAFGKRRSLVSFGTDAEGEVYMLELGGDLYRIVPAP